MKPRLMDPDHDIDIDAEVKEPPWADDLIADLGLGIVIEAMARGDALIGAVARSALVTPAIEPSLVTYRQEVLLDALQRPETVRELYDEAGQAIVAARRVWGSLFRTPSAVIRRSTQILALLVPFLRWMRDVTAKERPEWHSRALRELADVLARELDDAFFEEVDRHLAFLRFPHGALISARLGPGLSGTDYVLRRPNADSRGLLSRLLSRERGDLTYRLPERDEAGAKALAELRDRGLVQVADAVAQAAHHVTDFLKALRTELAFYVGCLNLAEAITAAGAPTAFPAMAEADGTESCPLRFTDLRDVALVLAGADAVVGNDLSEEDVRLLVVTGANRGGKSTLLRSLGQAQVMMQAGTFVAAASFESLRAPRVMTHFQREEDSQLRLGKLSDELERMSRIVDDVAPGDLLLCNESFSSTNEREGSEIARQVLEPLLDAGVRAVVVTHMFDLADGWFQAGRRGACFLRAEPESSAPRLYHLENGRPLSTSYGPELYKRVFADPTPASET